MIHLNQTLVTSLRISLAIWVGAAVLFVITSVAEQTSPLFDSVIRDQLATIRFPLYYGFGFFCHGITGLCAVTLIVTAEPAQKKRWRFVSGLILLATAGILLDYNWIYLPLQDLIVPPGSVRSPEFQRYHQWSTYANPIHVGLMLIAAAFACYPNAVGRESTTLPETNKKTT